MASRSSRVSGSRKGPYSRNKKESPPKTPAAEELRDLTAAELAADLNEQFITSVSGSLTKAAHRQSHPCQFDKANSVCYRQNREHFEKCAHPFHYCAGDIAEFKQNTDYFLAKTFKIYQHHHEHVKTNALFSDEWISEVGARRGDTTLQLAQSDFSRYDSFYFYLLANIMINLEEYVDKYTPKFLYDLLGTFESADATGLFKLNKESPIAQKMASCGLDAVESLLLSNTTIQKCIKNENLVHYNKVELNGGKKKTIRRGRKTIRRKTIRRKTIHRKRNRK